ncbi:hypothetical protein M433DRAFT_61575 [Acidomyces richmondensis BFW]|nr:MAG: hypothetical protein FE78DRAFT_151265 [Acidomyces sp. 'richmondensis']KYG48197.1 hypothetical protein M433DRAFT_61575 [Acidomyces richmondensis BFW]
MDISTPSLATTRTTAPSIQELDAIELSDQGRLAKGIDPQNLSSSNDIEASGISTPRRPDATAIVPAFLYPSMNKWRVLSACLVYFGNGMNDSAPGVLIPYMETYYKIGYAIVSLIWISNAVGFLLAAFCSSAIVGRLGQAKTLMISEACMTAGYIFMASSPPFPAAVVAYLVIGFGYAINLALNNVFCANLANGTVILGCAHGSYGVGGILGPVVATALVSNNVVWSRFYIIMIGTRVLCFLFVAWSFRDYENEGTTQFANSLQQTASSHPTTAMAKPGKLDWLGMVMRNSTALIGALFIFAYQGAEVSESGWFISYLINYRNGNPKKVGYVTAGFWGGITVGRFLLTHAARRVGERNFVLGLGGAVLSFQLMSWLIPNVVGDSAVAVALVGLLLGPVYPCAQTTFTRLLPGNIQVMAIGFISSAGSSGGAVLPFITGLLAQASGIWVLHPVCIGAFVLMLSCWAALPRLRKLKE